MRNSVANDGHVSHETVELSKCATNHAAITFVIIAATYLQCDKTNRNWLWSNVISNPPRTISEEQSNLFVHLLLGLEIYAHFIAVCPVFNVRYSSLCEWMLLKDQKCKLMKCAKRLGQNCYKIDDLFKHCFHW